MTKNRRPMMGESPQPVELPQAQRRVNASGPKVRLRNVFTLTSHSGSGGREHHSITAPKRGPDRQRAKQAIMTVLRRAERQSHRVSFVITFSDYSQLSMFELGFDPGLALTHCQSHRSDPYVWLSERARSETARAAEHVIIGVSILTWPRGPA